MTTMTTVMTLSARIQDARARTLALIAGLDDVQLMGPRLPIVNPLRWEIGHAAYFYELWVLRHHGGEAPIRPDVDQLYDSMTIAHDTRWDLPLPSLADTLAYMRTVQERVCARLADGTDDPRRDYLAQYALYHEDMHTEAFTYTRQTLGYRAPAIGAAVPGVAPADRPSGDAAIPGGAFLLGAAPADGFCFDNEQWAHPVEVSPSGTPVPRSATPSMPPLWTMADTGGPRYGTRTAGSGGPPPPWISRSIGVGRGVAGSSGASLSGRRCPRSPRSFM